MQKIFIKEFFKSFKNIGSIIPSSQALSQEIMKNINFKDSNVIVELGAGTGVFTDHLIKNRNKKTLLIIFENNQNFYNFLKEKYKNTENLVLLDSCASTLNEILTMLHINKIDYIISGLPFLSIPTQKRNDILKAIYTSPAKKIVLFQYTLKLSHLMNKFFQLISKKRVYLNFPPAYVLCYKNSKFKNQYA